MSSRMPVPDCRLPNSGVVYHELCHDPAPSTTFETLPGLSPSDVPSGPNAATLATVSGRAGLALGDDVGRLTCGIGTADAAGDVAAGAVFRCPPGRAVPPASRVAPARHASRLAPPDFTILNSQLAM